MQYSNEATKYLELPFWNLPITTGLCSDMIYMKPSTYLIEVVLFIKMLIKVSESEILNSESAGGVSYHLSNISHPKTDQFP